MKRIIVICLTIMVCICNMKVFAENTITVKVDSVAAKSGDSIDVNITLENNSGLIAALFDLTYDRERLKLTNVIDGGLVEGSVLSETIDTYPYKMLWNSASDKNFTEDGVLVKLTFSVLDNAPVGKAFINLDYLQRNVFNVALEDVKLSIEQGSINVKRENDSKAHSYNSRANVSAAGSQNSSDNNDASFVMSKKEEKTNFIDISEADWFYEAVQFAFENGITSGVTENSFAPNDKVTRGQFITMLCRAYGISEMTGDNFADGGNTWYTGYLAAAKQLGISNGVGDNKFAPDKNITREEMVTLIFNYLKSIGKVIEEDAGTDFADKDLISDWAKTAVSFASKNGIVKGKDNNMFDPQGNATRAELAQILYNLLNVE